MPGDEDVQDRLIASGLAVLEHRGLEAMALEEFVELGPIALGEGGGLSHVAPRDLEQPYEIVALELLARFLEWRQHAGVFAQCPLDEGCRNYARRGERKRLFEQVQELAHVAGPRRG